VLSCDVRLHFPGNCVLSLTALKNESLLLEEFKFFSMRNLQNSRFTFNTFSFDTVLRIQEFPFLAFAVLSRSLHGAPPQHDHSSGSRGHLPKYPGTAVLSIGFLLILMIYFLVLTLKEAAGYPSVVYLYHYLWRIKLGIYVSSYLFQ
jgi:hypothetical protein